MSPERFFAQALARLEWFQLEPEPPDSCESGRQDHACLLNQFLLTQHPDLGQLTPEGHRRLTTLVQRGVQILPAWPRPWENLVEHWVGSRFYLISARNTQTDQHLVSLACSHLGRRNHLLFEFPSLVERAIRTIEDRGHRSLLVPGTTTFDLANSIVHAGQTNSITLELPSKRSTECSIIDWLASKLEMLTTNFDPVALDNTIAVSPKIEGHLSEDKPAIHGPLQDRLALACADSVFALFIRDKGRVAKLLKERLSESNLPSASVRVLLPDRLNSSSKMSKSQAKSDWLQAGAVGWVVPIIDQKFPCFFSKCNSISRYRAAIQIVAPGSSVHLRTDTHPSDTQRSMCDKPGEFLVHCTRAQSNNATDAKSIAQLHQSWFDGQHEFEHALINLQRIADTRKLIGTPNLTRTTHKCVSLSAVPLIDLLQRREFQSHLGRWDWEPYGVLIRRSELERLGARPVIYGDETTYRDLSETDKPYFQPALRQGKKAMNWSEEREWRLLGDLDFKLLPPDAIQFFVLEKAQAMQLARRVNHPVLWVKETLR